MTATATKLETRKLTANIGAEVIGLGPVGIDGQRSFAVTGDASRYTTVAS